MQYNFSKFAYELVTSVSLLMNSRNLYETGQFYATVIAVKYSCPYLQWPEFFVVRQNSWKSLLVVINKPINCDFQDQLNSVIAMTQNNSLPASIRMALNTFIILQIHTKDILSELITNNVISEDDFNWLSKLR